MELLTDADLAWLRQRGMNEAEVRRQLALFAAPPAPTALARACTVGDGIRRLDEAEHPALLARWSAAAEAGRLSKFVPASGAASRMFQALVPLLAPGARYDGAAVAAAALQGDKLAKQQRDFGFLFVVSEETDSIGAKTFTKRGPHAGIRYVIDGEPTENQLMRGHKGVFAFKVSRFGRPGHSAYPELFDSAVHGLINELAVLTTTPLPSDESFGTTTVNVGRVQGGLAGNVIAESAEAEIVCRLARPLAEIEPMVRRVFSKETQLDIRTASDPAEIFVPKGYPSEIVRFGTDVPHLKPICPVLLVGPGSIHDAHTEHERLDKGAQLAAVELYARLVGELSSV